MHLTVVIVNYNTKQLLLDCLLSIYNAGGTPFPVECIVIDNCSTDGSVEAVRSEFPQVQLIANSENKFFSAANNQGIAAATGRYVMLLNPDTVVTGQTLQQLVEQMDQDTQIGAATTTLRFPDGTLQHTGSHFVAFGYLLLNYTFLGLLLRRQRQAANNWLWYRDWDRTTPRQIDVLPGSCIIAPRSVWLTLHGMNPEMLMYFSDDYFSRSVQRLGKSTVFLISDGIIHYEGMSTRQVSRRSLNLYMHDLLVYARLVFGRPAQVALAVLLIPTWIVQYFRARS